MTMHRGTAVYPGSFDPVTNGHIDIVTRSLSIFDSVTIAVLENSSKTTLFTPAERVEMFETATAGVAGVKVVTFAGLLVDLCEQVGSTSILRGLRFLSDYEYELQMALMNQSLKPGVETIFMVANPERTFVSSSLVKEVARLGRDISQFVPPNVAAALKGKYS